MWIFANFRHSKVRAFLQRMLLLTVIAINWFQFKKSLQRLFDVLDCYGTFVRKMIKTFKNSQKS